jgi:hypothetical protein
MAGWASAPQSWPVLPLFSTTHVLLCGNLARPLSFLQAWKKIEDTKKKAIDIMKVR